MNGEMNLVRSVFKSQRPYKLWASTYFLSREVTFEHENNPRP